MKYVMLGDRKVAAVGVGCWQFGAEPPGTDPASAAPASKAIVQRALDLGVNVFDTAEIYGEGRSEELLGRALAGRRDEAVIASKVSPAHARKRGVLAAAERSLARLGTETIDLYQLHWPSRLVPLSETMSAMRELQLANKIVHAGVSNFGLARWRRADLAFGQPVVANQVHFNLIEQGPLADLLPFAREQGRLIIAYSPLAQGLLGGRYGPENPPRDFRASWPVFSRANLAAAAPLLTELEAAGQRHGATSSQVALAWLLHLPNVMVIPGARSVEQLEANAGAADVDLSKEEWQRLQRVGASIKFEWPLRTRIRRAVSAMLGG